MITLAEIKEINVNTNLCKIRVPILEPVGNKKEVTMWATMILPPGIHAGYEVSDVVFVSFADNSLNRPVVLGQLYRGNQGTAIDNIGSLSDKIDKATSFSCVDLDATGKVILPETTLFEGDNSKTFKQLYEDVKQLRIDHDGLSVEYNALEIRCITLESHCNTLDDQYKALEKRYRDLEMQYIALASRLDTLEDNVESLPKS